jgi:hypothetical protein
MVPLYPPFHFRNNNNLTAYHVPAVIWHNNCLSRKAVRIILPNLNQDDPLVIQRIGGAAQGIHITRIILVWKNLTLGTLDVPKNISTPPEAAD